MPSNTPGLNKDTIDKNSDEKLIKVEVNIGMPGMRKNIIFRFPKMDNSQILLMQLHIQEQISKVIILLNGI